MSFRALVVSEGPTGQYERHVTRRTPAELPPGDVLVRVQYSSLNYKDALSASGHHGVTRRYPHVPGIDAAGVVVESTNRQYKPGDAVMVHAAEFGANVPGGYSEYARIPAEWLLPLPDGLTSRQCMAIGTAGITAALCVRRLQEQAVQAADGEVLVTGATGGVGIFSVALLARLGYRVVASTGKPAARDLLQHLGAAEVTHRASMQDFSEKALLKGRWSGVLDTVGGASLSTAIRSMHYGGVVVCCGNVAGADLVLTVYPFILRAVRLIGVDVANCPQDQLAGLWTDFGSLWPLDQFAQFIRECTLEELDVEIDRTLHGGRIGRTVVHVAGAQ